MVPDWGWPFEVRRRRRIICQQDKDEVSAGGFRDNAHGWGVNTGICQSQADYARPSVGIQEKRRL